MIDCVYISNLRVFRNGVVERYKFNVRKNKGGWKIIKNNINNMGYYNVSMDGKNVLRHRLIAYCFMGLENIKSNIKHTDGVIDHKNHNQLDNRVDNLRIITQRQNMENAQRKGYSWNKSHNKWRARIQKDGKEIHIGYFENENDAREAYLNAKRTYHII